MTKQAPKEGKTKENKKVEAVDFEEQLRTLRELVSKMEGGQLPLEQALASFEQGMKIAKECRSSLEQAQQKVELVLKKDEEFKTSAWEEE